jgi:hypothetical protein
MDEDTRRELNAAGHRIDKRFSHGPAHYDREGKPIGLGDFAMLHEDPDYIRVGSTHVADFWISTVWLGLDHNFLGEGPPLIFETMIFDRSDDRMLQEREYTMLDGTVVRYVLDDGWADLHCQRYATEDEAVKGHARTVMHMVRLVQRHLDEVEAITKGAHIDV